MKPFLPSLASLPSPLSHLSPLTRRALPLLAALTLSAPIAGCGGDSQQPGDDAGADGYTGGEEDAEIRDDAHTGTDARAPIDAPTSDDGGTGGDATTPIDAPAPSDDAPTGSPDTGTDSPAPSPDSSAPDTGATVDAGMGIDASDSGGANGGDAGVDATSPDAGATGNDAGGTADAGSSIPDAGSPPVDAGPPDTGTSPTDAGAPFDDAGSSPSDDAGSAPSDDAGAPPSDDAGGSGNDAGSGGGVDDAGGPTDAGNGGGTGGDAGIDGTAADAGTIVFVPGVQVSTLAGSNVAGTMDGTGAAAEFDNPTGMAIDAQGNLLVTDYDSSRVRFVTPQGVVTTVAAASKFVGPFAAVVATDGSYFVETDYNSAGIKNTTSGTIWRVIPLDDGGISAPNLLAQGFGRPRGLAAIAGGDLFITDRSQNVVQTVSAATGTATFVAGTLNTAGLKNGTGAGAEFSSPLGAATLADGSVLVADSVNNVIRRVDTSGAVTTFAGDGAPGVNDGPRLSAEFNTPRDVAVDAAGVVYVSDGGNHRLRRIRTDGTVETLAGDGTAGFNDAAGPSAEFYGQEGIDVTPDGYTLYVADGNTGDGSAYHRIRVVTIP